MSELIRDYIFFLNIISPRTCIRASAVPHETYAALSVAHITYGSRVIDRMHFCNFHWSKISWKSIIYIIVWPRREANAICSNPRRHYGSGRRCNVLESIGNTLNVNNIVWLGPVISPKVYTGWAKIHVAQWQKIRCRRWSSCGGDEERSPQIFYFL